VSSTDLRETIAKLRTLLADGESLGFHEVFVDGVRVALPAVLDRLERLERVTAAAVAYIDECRKSDDGFGHQAITELEASVKAYEAAALESSDV
jgi:hypothetical protein